MEKVIGMIPARYNSSRLPGKPLIKICGRELIKIVYENVNSVKKFDELFIVTDDKRIENFCIENDMPVLMTSPNCATGTDRLYDAIKRYNIDADFIINIQGDEPLINASIINKIIKYHLLNPDCDAINIMVKIICKDDINDNTVVKVVFNENNDLIYLSRSAVPGYKGNKGIEYYKHCGVYGIKKEALLFFGETKRGRVEKIEDIEMLRFIENQKKVKIIPVLSESIGVDTIEDIKKLEKVYMCKDDQL